MVTNMFHKINIKRVTVIYILVYFIIMGMYCGIAGSQTSGEWDDYVLPAVSIIESHKLTVTEADISAFKEMFPEWAEYTDVCTLSGYTAKNGGRMSFYFPTYSAACVPMILLLQFLDLPARYAFAFTNLAMIMILLMVVLFCLKASDLCKLTLIVLLSANPIVFYFVWISAETFMFATIGIAMVFWYNKQYKRAAIFISVAGMLNPVIMSIGIVMIIEYLARIWESREVDESFFHLLSRNLKDLICYGLCYVIGLIPMIYNYYHIGHINITASYSGFLIGSEYIFYRFLAYLFDLNFGIFPYYPFILIIGIVLFIVALIRRHWRYVGWITAFAACVICYSIMFHINCGMAGIARYNAWGAVVLVFAVCLYFNELVDIKMANRAVRISLAVNGIIMGIIVYQYGPIGANKTSCLNWTPVAEYVLDHFPALYNPLHSTFNSRIIHQDGGYSYTTPIVYSAEDGYVRKILAKKDDVEVLKKRYLSLSEDKDWFEKHISNLPDKETYISVPPKYQVIKCEEYELGSTIWFYSEKSNFDKYMISDFPHIDVDGAWTLGNEMIMNLHNNSDSDILHFYLDCGVFNNRQSVQIFINDVLVYDNVVENTPIEFDFENPGAKVFTNIKFKFPDANSPIALGLSEDTRILALHLKSMVISEK